MNLIDDLSSRILNTIFKLRLLLYPINVADHYKTIDFHQSAHLESVIK